MDKTCCKPMVNFKDLICPLKCVKLGLVVYPKDPNIDLRK